MKIEEGQRANYDQCLAPAKLRLLRKGWTLSRVTLRKPYALSSIKTESLKFSCLDTKGSDLGLTLKTQQAASYSSTSSEPSTL